MNWDYELANYLGSPPPPQKVVLTPERVEAALIVLIRAGVDPRRADAYLEALSVVDEVGSMQAVVFRISPTRACADEVIRVLYAELDP